jgi:hypothetical protein
LIGIQLRNREVSTAKSLSPGLRLAPRLAKIRFTMRRLAPLILGCCLFGLLPSPTLRGDDLPELAAQFWEWRAQQQPFGEDDIPRIERPGTFVSLWSPAQVEAMRGKLADFETRWRAINVSGESISNQVDYRLIGSALARVHWELDVEQGWKRNPLFYVHRPP